MTKTSVGPPFSRRREHGSAPAQGLSSAARTRLAQLHELLDATAPTREIPMFGTVVVMVGTHMAAAVTAEGHLLLNCREDDAARLLAMDGVTWPVMEGQPMSRGWVQIDKRVLTSLDDLRSWLVSADGYRLT